MAGYELSFKTESKYRKESQKFCQYLQSIYKMYDLEFHYKTKIISNELEVHIQIDGNLPAMQHLYRISDDIFQYYLHFVNKGKDVLNNIIIPFLENNKKGLSLITNTVYQISRYVGGKPNPFSVPVKILKMSKSSCRGHRRSQFIKATLSYFDLWYQGKLNKNNTVILFDKVMENLLKQKVGIPQNSKIKFPDLLERALSAGIITKKEKNKLAKYHVIRNKIQHRNKSIKTETFESMLEFIIQFIMNKY